MLTINAKYSDVPQTDLVAWAENAWGLPLWMENDMRAAMIGEWRFGQGRGYDNLVLMTLGTGIGTSAVIEGRVLRGKHFQAGILGGHVIINRHGNRCNCGMVGCAEAEASTWTLQNLVINHSLYPQSVLSQESHLDFKTVFQCAEAGDALARIVRDECVDVWASCAYNLVQAYDPEVVILGGGIIASRAFINIQWTRTANWTEAHLINHIESIDAGDGWREERTGLDEGSFIETRRHWFSKKVTHNTNGVFNVLILIEGAEAIVESPSGAFAPFVVHYVETFNVPAIVGEYTVRPYGLSEGREIGTIKAYIRTTNLPVYRLD